MPLPLARPALLALALAPLLAACGGNDLRSGIVGTWQRAVPTSGVHQRYSFAPDGGLTIATRRPIGPSMRASGTYAFSDDSTVVLTYGARVDRFTAALRADTLTLRPSSGPPLRLTRAAEPAEPPAPAE